MKPKLLVMASERAARAASFDAALADDSEIVSLDAWLARLADGLDARITEASSLEEIALAAEVIRAAGGNPGTELARDVVSRLRKLDEADVDTTRSSRDKALAAAPYFDLAGALARALSQRGRRNRASAARAVADRLQGEPLFAQTLDLPDRVVVRDVVRITPALLRLFRELARVMDRRGKRFEVELALVERPLGGAARDALERIGDLYAEALDGPPVFRAFPIDDLAECMHWSEPDPESALTRSMALVAAALDVGVAPDACGVSWPRVPSDAGLRALAHAARGADVPVLADRRATSARSIDELLRWCELLSGELRFDELLALLRSPLLELLLDGPGDQAAALARLISAPLPRGPAYAVLRAVALAEADQEGAAVYRTLAALSTRLTDACTVQQSCDAIGHALVVLGLARGASRGGTTAFRADHWPGATERALLASIASEERALSSFEALRAAWLGAARATSTAGSARGVGDLARDLRHWLDGQAPRMAGNPAGVRTGSLGALACERTAHVVVPDASFEAWSSHREETAPQLLAAERLAALGQEAEWLLLRIVAQQIHVVTSSGDARGEPQRLHPMFGAAEPAASAVRLALSHAEVRARRQARTPATEERIRRQRAREAWRGTEPDVADRTTGLLAGGLPWLASAAKPLSPNAAEQFVACPFRGFVVQELRARSETDADSVADPTEEGRILHELLEKAFLAAKEELSRPEPDAARVRELGARAALEASRHLLVGIRKVQVQRLLAWVTRALDEAARDRTWRFDAAEVAFGPGQKWPPVEVAGTWYAGRIDRIDRGRAGTSETLRVVDYKRSTVGSTKLRLQLPIYAIAAERNDSRHAIAKEGAYLVPRRAGGSSGVKLVPLDPSATELVRAGIVPTLLRLREGDVAPRPNTPRECSSCDARGVCRRPPFRVQEGP